MLLYVVMTDQDDELERLSPVQLSVFCSLLLPWFQRNTICSSTIPILPPSEVVASGAYKPSYVVLSQQNKDKSLIYKEPILLALFYWLFNWWIFHCACPLGWCRSPRTSRVRRTQTSWSIDRPSPTGKTALWPFKSFLWVVFKWACFISVNDPFIEMK